jgi:hypothetical protein
MPGYSNSDVPSLILTAKVEVHSPAEPPSLQSYVPIQSSRMPLGEFSITTVWRICHPYTHRLVHVETDAILYHEQIELYLSLHINKKCITTRDYLTI